MIDPPIIQRLHKEPYVFDFFQAVRLLHRLPAPYAIAESSPRPIEAARFQAHLTLAFPASAIQELEFPDEPLGTPKMTVTFLGLTGPSGVLPRHYTERLLTLEASRRKIHDAGALRDWFTIFDHRFIDLFYRAWEKYRFWVPYERGEADRLNQDPFTLILLSYVGLGTPWLRDRMVVAAPQPQGQPDQELGRVHDLALLHYAGILSRRQRTAWGLQALLSGYFGLSFEVDQFQGQWLPLDASNQSRMPGPGDPDLPLDANCQLGENLVAGDRVWDVQSKVRVRLGPLKYREFLDFLPDRAPIPERKSFFLLSHVIRFYLGPEFDFEVQLVLRREDVPVCRLTADEATGPRLGWNCWILSDRAKQDADDAVFEGAVVTRLGSA